MRGPKKEAHTNLTPMRGRQVAVATMHGARRSGSELPDLIMLILAVAGVVILTLALYAQSPALRALVAMLIAAGMLRTLFRRR